MVEFVTLPEYVEAIRQWASEQPGVEEAVTFGAHLDDCRQTTVVVDIETMEGEQHLGDVWEAWVSLELTVQVPRPRREREPTTAVGAMDLALELGLQARWKPLGGGCPVELVTVDRDAQPELLGRWDTARVAFTQLVRFAPRGTEGPTAESVDVVLASRDPKIGPAYRDEYEVVSDVR